MAHRVCPWWIGYLLASPLRRLFDDPARILDSYVRPGMTVLEPGPGMGFFTLELARQVGPTGRVIAIDIQPKMLAGLRRRATRAGLAERIDARLAEPQSLAVTDLSGSVDFVLAYAVVHEMSAPDRFFQDAAQVLKPGGSMLLVEPSGHVSTSEFEAELRMAASSGLVVISRPPIHRSQSVLLQNHIEGY